MEDEQVIKGLFSEDSFSSFSDELTQYSEDDYPFVEDIDFTNDEFVEIKGETPKILNKKLLKYQEELQLSLALRISLQTPSVLNSISETIYKNIGGPICYLNDISDVFFYEYARRMENIEHVFSLAAVNKHYNYTFKNNLNMFVTPYIELREIPLQKSIALTSKLINRNICLIRNITGVNAIFTNLNKKRKTTRVLCPRIMIFRMVALCDKKYQINKNTPIYFKIKINYKAGDKSFYFHQNNCLDDAILREGCYDEKVKELLR